MGRRREKGGEETRQGGYLLLPTIHRSIYLGRRFGGGIGGRGGKLRKEEIRRTGGSGLFSLSLSITMAEEWAEYGRSGWAYLACDLRLLSTLLLSSFVLGSFLDLIPLAEPQKRSPSNNSLVSSVAWFYF